VAHAEVKIILDTFPYPGGTTTCEALWMGVPTVTLAVDSMLARQGASLLTATELDECVATNKAEYIAKAIAWPMTIPSSPRCDRACGSRCWHPRCFTHRALPGISRMRCGE
jgi:hypothetical protein